MDISPQPKPEPIARVKRRHKREEAKLARIVRDACVERDGFCRLFSGTYTKGDTQSGPDLDYCGSRWSEWAHLEDKRRFKTRGMAPEERHTTRDSCMLCNRHHPLYDAREITLTFLSELGADGSIAWERT